jgi:hypothetical protein
MYEKGRELKQFSGPPLLIYQMGKVGSKSVKKSLEALNLDMPLYHSHLLTKARIAETEKQRQKFFRTSREPYLRRPWLNQFLRNEIDKGLSNKKWKIITLTRDPIARNVSTFFENLQVSSTNDSDTLIIGSDYYDISPTTVELNDIHELEVLFFEKLHHDTPLEFFDRELKAVFGVDVYNNDFPKSTGYQIFNDKIADVLLIRLEDINRCAGEAFKRFLNIDNFKLKNENVGSDKLYSELYTRFKQQITFPKSYIDRFYNSKFMRHFYSKEEIKRFLKLWNKN